MGARAVLRRVLPLLCLAACGGGSKKEATKPEAVTPPPPPPETEADREQKRHAASVAIIPDGSTCLPAVLKEDNGPRLDLAAVGDAAVVCAMDTDKTRLLGAIGCWKVDLSSGALTYQAPTPLPGHNVDVLLDGRCARGFCLPDDAKLPDTKIVHLSWSNPEGAKVAMQVGDEVHVFDAASKAQSGSFSIRGDKGVTGQPIAVYFNGDNIFVEGNDGTTTEVWEFKSDGTPSGPLTGIGGDAKPLSTYHGSVCILDKNRVGIAERGFTSMTTLEMDSGKRTKAVRKIGKLACKPDEVEAYWHDGDKVSDKCKGSITSQFATFIGATALMGQKSLLVLLRDDRAGELAVMDPKSLAEKKAIKMPWCDAQNAPAAGGKTP